MAVMLIVVSASVYIVLALTWANTTTGATTHCTTMYNSIECGSRCDMIRKGGPLLFHTVDASGLPLPNISINVYYSTPFCTGLQFSPTVGILRTNTTGWASYDLRVVGSYMFVINGMMGYAAAEVSENVTTYVTIQIPSYNITMEFKPLR
jgi:hypothetical protein